MSDNQAADTTSAKERAAFERGVRAALEAAAIAADKAAAANLILYDHEPNDLLRTHFKASWAEAEMLARTIRAIDPATIKGDTDNG